MSTIEATAPIGRLIRGPTALGQDPKRLLALTWTLAVLEFRLRFFGSMLGYLWQLMRPLMLFGILYLVFTQVVRVGDTVKFYPVVLLSGIVLYTFLAEATSASVTAVVDRENLVRKIDFPRLAIPLSVVLTSYFNLLLNLIAVMVFMLVSGVELHTRWLLLVPLLLFLGVFVGGLAMLLSALYVRFRDMRPIWDVALPIIFYGSPILYPIETVPEGKLRSAVMCNPLASVVQEVRHNVIDTNAPSAADVLGGEVRLLIPVAIVLLTVAVGFWYFNREAPHIAEEL